MPLSRLLPGASLAVTLGLVGAASAATPKPAARPQRPVSLEAKRANKVMKKIPVALVEWTPTKIVEALELTQLRAWRRADGATRFDVVVTNTSPKAYQLSMGEVGLQNYKLVGSSWSPAGGWAVQALAPGATFQIKDQPFPGGTSTQLRSVIQFSGKDFATRTVPIGAEPADVQTALEMKARRILEAVTYDLFTARTDVNGAAVWDLVIRNNTDEAFTADLGSLVLICEQVGMPICFRTIPSLPARGTVAFRNASFIDKGGNSFSVALNHNKQRWQPRTIPIVGAAERDQRALAILVALKVESLTVRRLSASEGDFTLVVRNPTSYAFQRIGSITVQAMGLVGTAWKPKGGWSMDTIPAQGTATMVHTFPAAGVSQLKVNLGYKASNGAEAVTPVP